MEDRKCTRGNGGNKVYKNDKFSVLSRRTVHMRRVVEGDIQREVVEVN
jgi:hypothetical protein